jgi:hypothetical protein
MLDQTQKKMYKVKIEDGLSATRRPISLLSPKLKPASFCCFLQHSLALFFAPLLWAGWERCCSYFEAQRIDLSGPLGLLNLGVSHALRSSAFEFSLSLRYLLLRASVAHTPVVGQFLCSWILCLWTTTHCVFFGRRRQYLEGFFALRTSFTLLSTPLSLEPSACVYPNHSVTLFLKGGDAVLRYFCRMDDAKTPRKSATSPSSLTLYLIEW